METHKDNHEPLLTSPTKTIKSFRLSSEKVTTKTSPPVKHENHKQSKERQLPNNQMSPIKQKDKTNMADGSPKKLTEGERAYWQQRMPRGFQFYMDRLAKAVIRHQPSDVPGFCLAYMEQTLVARNAERQSLPDMPYFSRLYRRRVGEKIVDTGCSSNSTALKLADSNSIVCPLGNSEIFPDIVPQEFISLDKSHKCLEQNINSCTTEAAVEQKVFFEDPVENVNFEATSTIEKRNGVIEDDISNVSASLNSDFTRCPSHKESQSDRIGYLGTIEINDTHSNSTVKKLFGGKNSENTVVEKDMHKDLPTAAYEKPQQRRDGKTFESTHNINITDDLDCNEIKSKVPMPDCCKNINFSSNELSNTCTQQEKNSANPCLVGFSGLYQNYVDTYVDEEIGSSVDPPFITTKDDSRSLSAFVDNIIQTADIHIQDAPNPYAMKVKSHKLVDAENPSTSSTELEGYQQKTSTTKNKCVKDRLSPHEQDIIKSHIIYTNKETEAVYLGKSAKLGSETNLIHAGNSGVTSIKTLIANYQNIINENTADDTRKLVQDNALKGDPLQESLRHLEIFTNSERLWSLMPEYYITESKEICENENAENFNDRITYYDYVDTESSLKLKKQVSNYTVSKIPPAKTAKFDNYIVTESVLCKGQMHNTRYFPQDSGLQESLQDLTYFTDDERMWATSTDFFMSKRSMPLKFERSVENENMTVHKLISDIVQKAAVVVQNDNNMW